MVARLPGARFVLLLQPVGDNRLATTHRLLALVVGVVSVGGVLGEEGSYGRGVVSAPGVHVGVAPPLHSVVGQDAPPSATSECSRLIAVLVHTACGPTVSPFQLPNILRHQERRCSPPETSV